MLRRRGHLGHRQRAARTVVPAQPADQLPEPLALGARRARQPRCARRSPPGPTRAPASSRSPSWRASAAAPISSSASHLVTTIATRALSRTAAEACSASSSRRARVTAISDSPGTLSACAVEHDREAVGAPHPRQLVRQRAALAHALELLAREVAEQQLDAPSVGAADPQVQHPAVLAPRRGRTARASGRTRAAPGARAARTRARSGCPRTGARRARPVRGTAATASRSGRSCRSPPRPSRARAARRAAHSATAPARGSSHPRLLSGAASRPAGFRPLGAAAPGARPR